MPSATKDRKKQKKQLKKQLTQQEKQRASKSKRELAAPSAKGRAKLLATGLGAGDSKGPKKGPKKGDSQKKGGAKKGDAKKGAAHAVKSTGKAAKAAEKAGKTKLKKANSQRKPKLTAATADRYDLYQRSVNSPEADVDFLFKVYERLRDGARPKHLREDFCGTANLAAEWLRRGAELTAEGFDLDPEPIEWGKGVNFADVEDGLERMTFHLADVRSRPLVKPDITTAPNFSYWCFRTRDELKGYFRSAFEGLAARGLFVIDVYGGPEALVEMEEQRDVGDGLTYIWDQRQYWPGTGEYHAAIHFSFKDGTEMRDAFQYVWRFWNLTELKDLLSEVGFRSVTTWFEGTDPDDEEVGDGNFELDEKGENCQAWIGYIVAAK
ncbi:MAG: class I SAM-dependent methyltransferase [Planctomycetota bacterium]